MSMFNQIGRKPAVQEPALEAISDTPAVVIEAPAVGEVTDVVEAALEAVVDVPTTVIDPLEIQDALVATNVAVEALDTTPPILETPAPGMADYITVIGQRSSYPKTHLVVDQMVTLNNTDIQVRNLHHHLDMQRMIHSFTQVTQDHALSKHVVATMRATPGFELAVTTFPEPALFNAIPEHKSSAKQAMGLESLTTAAAEASDTISGQASLMVNTFDRGLSGIGVTATEMKSQLTDSAAALSSSDVTEEVLATLLVSSLSEASLNLTFTKLNENLKGIELFNVDELRSNPERLVQEITGLQNIVAEVGGILGLELTQSGLTDAERGNDYIPTQGSFAEKSLTKTGLELLVYQADGLMDTVNELSLKRDDIVAALHAECGNMPESLVSDDAVYGCVDHVTLVSCYVTLVSKLVAESFVATSRLLGTLDAVLDIDTGVTVD